MEPVQDKEDTDIFPMAIACTGCATRYRIDRPRAFECPHCGNHIEILEDGKVEITLKKAYEMEIQQLEEPLTDTPSQDIKKTIEEEKEIKKIIEEEEEILTAIQEPEKVQEPTEPSKKEEEKVLEIRARKALTATSMEKESEGKDVPAEAEEVIKTAEPISSEPEEQMQPKVPDEDLMAEKLREEIRKEEARLERLKREQSLLGKRKMKESEKPVKIEETESLPLEEGEKPAAVVVRGKEKGETKEKPMQPVVPSYYSRPKKQFPSFHEYDKKQKALIALGVVAIILVAAILYAIIMEDGFTVKMPDERIGDRGTYDVDGRVWVSSPGGISTGNRVIQDLNIEMDGETTYQINDTVEIEDGFGVERDCLDKYLWQKLRLSGSVELLGIKTEIPDAGTLETKTSSYICLVTNETVRTNVFNDLDVNILPEIFVKSKDKGLYYPAGDSMDYNLFNVRDRKFSEGDEGVMAGGQLRWKAEEVEKVYKWDCLKLHITENNSDAEWRQFSGDIWVANECSLPVKVHIRTKIDTSKLTPTQKLVISLFTLSEGILEVDYTATMRGYHRGDTKIPWNPSGKDPSIDQREDVQFDENWSYAPLLRKETPSFDPDFSPEEAAKFAVNESSDLRSYVSRHEDVVYVVDGKYSVDNDTQFWQLMFGYRVSGFNANANGYNITIKKNGSKLSIHFDPGEETINNPSNSRDEIEHALNIVDVENIFGNMTLVSKLFDNGEVDFDDETDGKIAFEIQNNHLHTGLSMSSSFNPIIQNTIPAGYGYYLQRERKDGEKYYFLEGMVDAQDGRIIYEVDHYQRAQF